MEQVLILMGIVTIVLLISLFRKISIKTYPLSVSHEKLLVYRSIIEKFKDNISEKERKKILGSLREDIICHSMLYQDELNDIAEEVLQ